MSDNGNNELPKEHADLYDVMRTRQGRAVLNEILSQTRIDLSSFTDGTANQTIFNEGQRSVGLKLHGMMLEVDHGICAQMMKERYDG